MNFKLSGRKVKDLLNGEEVTLLSGRFAYNTLVEWVLADFLDDVPPFLEVCFNERMEGDTVYHTANVEHDLYELNGLIFIFEKGEDDVRI